jgi:hypothetical protein
MKEPSCDDVLMAQMAVSDHEEAGSPTERLAAHIAGCANCQHELKQIQGLDQVLSSYALAEPSVDLWPAIENRIVKRSGFALGWQPFALIGLLLVVHKLLELLPARDPGMAFKLVPLVIVVLLFILIRENPFKINTELAMER